jgi:Leucine Rich repeat
MSKDTSCIDTRATSPLPIFLALESRQIPIITIWLNVQSFGVLDMAVSSYGARQQWLTVLKSITCQAIDVLRHSHSSIRWVIERSIRVNQILIRKHLGGISDRTFEAVNIHGSRTSCGEVVKGDSMLSIWEESQYLLTIDLSCCWGITDIGLSALGRGCGQLQAINLNGCQGITDIGLSALSDGCGQLQLIDLTDCQGITDIGLSALSDGCGCS